MPKSDPVRYWPSVSAPSSPTAPASPSRSTGVPRKKSAPPARRKPSAVLNFIVASCGTIRLSGSMPSSHPAITAIPSAITASAQPVTTRPRRASESGLVRLLRGSSAGGGVGAFIGQQHTGLQRSVSAGSTSDPPMFEETNLSFVRCSVPGDFSMSVEFSATSRCVYMRKRDKPTASLGQGLPSVYGVNTPCRTGGTPAPLTSVWPETAGISSSSSSFSSVVLGFQFVSRTSARTRTRTIGFRQFPARPPRAAGQHTLDTG